MKLGESDVCLVKTKGRQVGILLEGEGRLRIRIRIEAGRREMKLLSHDQFVSHVQYMTVQTQAETEAAVTVLGDIGCNPT
jgi:hypothetical protein